MSKFRWIKDAFFILLVLGGSGLLAMGLMSTDRIGNLNPPADSTIQPQSIRDVVQQVDRAFASTWTEAERTPAPPAQPMTVARRLGLGLAGTIPSLEELRRFESLPPEDRIHWWVSRLLQDQRSADFMAERLARAMVGVENGPFLVYRRRRFVAWLSEQLRNNRPYDQLVRTILTEEGLWTDTPAVNFYTRAITEDNERRPDPVWLAGRTSRVFLGMRIDCLQCHDDFLGTINLGSAESPSGGSQLDFHGLAAFFADTENSVLGIRDNRDASPYTYVLLGDSDDSVVEPAVPFYPELDQPSLDLRGRLAHWVTHPDNRAFARATVNRIWAIMTGRGLVEPVDHLPIDGDFPAPLELLVDDLVAHEFDLRRLIHIIAQTRAFQLDSAADFEIDPVHERVWAVFPMNRLRPDQVAGAIAQSTQISTIDATSHILTRLTRFGQQNDFVQRFGDPGEDEFEDRGETVTQRLLMLNGDMISERIDNGLNSCVHVSGLAPDAATAVDVIYLSTLTRYPTPDERDHFAAPLEPLTGPARRSAVVDLYWSLINSAEFRWNH